MAVRRLNCSRSLGIIQPGLGKNLPHLVGFQGVGELLLKRIGLFNFEGGLVAEEKTAQLVGVEFGKGRLAGGFAE